MALKSRATFAAGVDVGSRRVRCVAGVVEDRRFRFLGAGMAPGMGWNRGRVRDAGQIAASIEAAVRECEERAGVQIESAVFGIGGPAIEAVSSRGVYEYPRPSPVQRREVDSAVELASRPMLEQDRMVLQVLPQDFSLDGKAGYRTVTDVVCSQLEAHVLLVTTSEKEHEMTVAAAHRAHMRVEDTVSEAVAAAYASIMPPERQRGAALLDIGMDSSEIVVYDGDAAVGVAPLPLAGETFTRDLVQVFNEVYGHVITHEDAELLKCEYGCALLGLTPDNVLVEVPAADGINSREFSRRQVNEILEARAEELFEMVKAYLGQLGMEKRLMEGIFLTGGGARLPGMLDMAERVLNCPAKFGLAAGIQDWPSGFDDASWTTAAGLALYSARLKLDGVDGSGPGLLGLLGW